MPISLIRSAWAGSAKYGALVWSGDIVSSFECFQRQVQAGLNMAIAGIPWWTTDIGGFHGARTDDPDFHRLYIRWFEYGCFCPVMRLHGNRNPQEGYGAEQIGGLDGWLCGYDLVVNTVPAPVLGETELKDLRPDCLIIDLASKPGGVDRKAQSRSAPAVIMRSGALAIRHMKFQKNTFFCVSA